MHQRATATKKNDENDENGENGCAQLNYRCTRASNNNKYSTKIHNERDRLHNKKNEEYTKYTRKIDGYCGLRYHSFNNDIFEILIRYSMAPQRGDLQKGTLTDTIKWYDNLLSQCFEDYDKS